MQSVESFIRFYGFNSTTKKNAVSVHNGSTPIIAQLNLRNLCRLANLPVEIYLRFIVRAPVYHKIVLLRISFTKDSAFYAATQSFQKRRTSLVYQFVKVGPIPRYFWYGIAKRRCTMQGCTTTRLPET